jgi:hypothetical protein
MHFYLLDRGHIGCPFGKYLNFQKKKQEGGVVQTSWCQKIPTWHDLLAVSPCGHTAPLCLSTLVYRKETVTQALGAHALMTLCRVKFGARDTIV